MPPFTVGHDGDLELPCPEALWQARSEAEWIQARDAEASSSRGGAGGSSPSPTTVRAACALIVDYDDAGSPPIAATPAMGWSPFAVVCVMHILATRLWHVGHGTLSSATSTALRPLTAAQRAPSLLATGRRCHDLIRAHHAGNTHAGRDARRQLAAAADVLRVCYGRTVPALARLDCDALLRGGEDDVRAAAGDHVSVPLERTPQFTLAAAVAFEGLCAPLACGAQVCRKTGALGVGLEAVVAGWDNCESRPARVEADARKLRCVLGSYRANSQLFVRLKHSWCPSGPTWSAARGRWARSWTARRGSCCRASPPCFGRRRARSRTTAAAPSRGAC